MVKKSLLWFWRATLWVVAIACLIMLIAALTIQFWIMPNIARYKNDIAAVASKATKQKVAIGNITADWQGINPHLKLSNIDLFDTQGRVALRLTQTDVLISWLSLPMLEPHLAKLAIHAPELTIRRIASGEIFIAGISMRSESKPELANWLLRQNSVEIDQAKISWLDEKRNAPTISLNQFNLRLESPLWRGLVKNHRVSINTIPSIGTANPILLSANIYGNDVAKTQDWDGSVNLELKNTDLSIFKAWLDYPIDLQSGLGSMNIKIKFSHQQLLSIASELDVQNLQLQPKSAVKPIHLRRLSGNLVWENLNKIKSLENALETESYKINLSKLSAQSDDGLDIKNLKAEFSNINNSKQNLNLRIASFDLASVQQYIDLVPMSEKLRLQINNAALTGKLGNFSLDWSAINGVTTAYQLNTKFNKLGMQAQNLEPNSQIPGFSNFSGELKATQKGGQITLKTSQAMLDYKNVLRWPIPIDSMEGELAWSVKNDIIALEVNDLSVKNPHLSGTLNANYTMDGIKGGYLDLAGKFDNANAKYAMHYYPISLGETTLHWLDTSILDGNLSDINLSIKGRLADFPFVNTKNQLDERLGLFRVTAKLSNILLEYGTGWPVIDKLGMQMLFEGNRMELNASTGNILGNQIIKSKITIPELDADFPLLTVDADVIGSVGDGVNFVNKSPVRDATQGFTDNLITSGSGKLTLNLKIPLEDLDASKYKGLYQITNGRMESSGMPALSQINGNLEFTENSLTAKNIKAYAFGSPLAFNLNSGKDKIIRVAARGKLSEDSIKQLLREQNLSKVSGYISGGTDWAGNIMIQKPRVNLSLRSDLNGIALRFPAPMDKALNQPISLRIDKKQDASTDVIYINYGNKINTKIIRTIENSKAKLAFADIHFNSDNAFSNNDAEQVRESRTTGVAVSGKLDYLDADAWRYVFKTLSDGGKQSAPLSIKKTNLSITALDIFDRRINQLKINNIANKEGLQANIQSREISGDIQWLNQNNGKLIARLTNLTIPDSAPDRISAIKDTADSSSNKYLVKQEQGYPALDIYTDNFEFDKKNFGSVELIAYPQHENWNIQKFKITSPDGVINGDGQWNNWIKNPNTALNVNWDIKDLGGTLKRFGYPDAIKDGSGELKGKLSWPGSPSQFNTARLNGEMAFDVRKGQILQVQPGVGRLLGLVSLQSLPRRLTLDFRDLFSNGFAFDKINATVRINQGVMRSDNFVMSGPAADVEIKGETNLEKETQHLYVNVMPRISDSISLAALAGGPLAGAVAFLAQKVLKDPLNKIASTEYEIIGTWDNPQEVKANESNSNKPKNNNIFQR
jgi:uncharacterized protein (TIGR02099 family)